MEANGFERVAVLGSGRTAPGIAAACAAAGCEVRVLARDGERAAAAAALAARLGRGEVSAGTIAAEALAGADLVIETVAEDHGVKTTLLARIERWIRPDAVIASNTSSLSITSLGAALATPARFAGLHFLFPAHETAAVEVVAGDATAPETVAALAGLVEAMGKTPLLVRKDVPGFVWNRLQFALFREALALLEDGVADVEAIDAAVAEGLAPRWLASGPFATADLGGIRTFAAVAEQLFAVLSNAREVPAALGDRAAAGETFYGWTPEAEEEISRLRGEAGRAVRDVAAARRDGTPPSRPG